VQDGLRAELKDKSAQLAVLSICAQGYLYPLLVPVANAVRIELGEPIDEGVYERVLKRASGLADQYRHLLPAEA
jgi:hypothetical protein